MLTPLFAKWFGVSDISSITPLLAIHILWVNLVTDSLPALALAVDPAEKDIMNRPPRKNTKGIFTGGMIYRVVYQGIMIGILTLLSFVLGLATTRGLADGERIMIAQTMAFIVLAFSELVHVFNVRNNEKSIFKTGILSNKKLLLAIAVSSLLILAILFVPQLREIFSIAVLPKENIFEVIVLIIAPLVIVEILKLLKINTLKGKE